MDTDTMSIEDAIFAELNGVTPTTAEVEEAVEEVTAPVEPEPVLEATEWADLGDGKRVRSVPFEELFGWKPTFVPNFLVPVFEGFEVSKVPDPYIPPREQFEQYAFYSVRGRKTNLVGPTGAGKTVMAEFFAAKCGRPFLRIEHNIELDKASVFGQVHITEGDTDFVPGMLPRAMAEPTVVMLDELTRATGHANMIYQRVFDRNELFMPEMKDAGLAAVKPNPYFVICASDNTKGDGEDTDLYPASNVQDAAFRNRFDALIEVPYATQAEEEALVKHLLTVKVSKRDIKSLCQFSFLLHSGFEDRTISTAFSPRQLINICKDVNDGMTMAQSIRLAYINFCSKSELSDVMETYRTAFGSDLI